MSKKHKKICTAPNYIKHFLILGSTITACTSIYALASSVGIPIGITSSAIGSKTCALTAGIKKYKSLIKKRKKKHDKIVLLPNVKLSSVEVLISKSLIDLVISNDEFVLIKNVLKEYNEMKEEIKNLQI